MNDIEHFGISSQYYSSCGENEQMYTVPTREELLLVVFPALVSVALRSSRTTQESGKNDADQKFKIVELVGIKFRNKIM